MSLLVRDAANLADAFYRQAAASPQSIVYSQAQIANEEFCLDEPREWKGADFAAVRTKILRLSKHLQSIGVTQKTSVAIVSSSRPEWMIADLAILSCAGISVSVYQSLPADDIAYILFDSNAEFVFAENQEQVDKILSLVDSKQDIPATEDRPAQQATIPIRKIIAFEEVTPHPLVMEYENCVLDSSVEEVIPEAVASISRSDTASLVYTSGTTGPPKGVIQTHGNHLANVRQAFESEMLTEENSLAVFLPLAHAFAKLMGYIGFLTPAEIKFPAIVDKKSSRMIPQSISKDIREGSAHINPLVPRLLEKMKEGVLLKSRSSGVGGKLLSLAIRSAQNCFQARKAGKEPKLLDSVWYTLTTPLRKKVAKALFGPNFQFCVSGGAKLAVPVNEFFAALEIPIIEGYGLTETCVATNVGRIRSNKIGTVGPVLSSDIEMRIADDGEVLYRGPNIAVGYHGRPTATRAAWDEDGWFHTGDLGTVDDDGYLSIVGRKKEILVTSGGKNIAPHDIETQIKEHPLVSQAVLLGDGRKYCVAVLTVSTEEAQKWLEKQSSYEPGAAMNDQQALVDHLWQHIAAMNKELASYETVKKIFIAPEDFTVENGMLTPTFKVKRAVVEKTYLSEIEALY